MKQLSSIMRSPVFLLLLLSMALTSFTKATPTANLTDFGGQPGPEHDNRLAFSAAIVWLSENPGGTLLIPEGAFYIKTNPTVVLTSGASSEAHLNFEGLQNVTIAGEGSGSEIVLGQFAMGLLFENCDGLTLRNLTFDYAFPLFSQGEVLAISDANNTIILKPDPGYPSPHTEVGTVPFGRPGWLTLNREGMNLAFPEALSATSTEQNADGTVLYHYNNQKNVSKRLRGEGPLRYVRVARHGNQLIRLRDCSDVLLEGLRIHAASGFTILGSMCRNVTVRDCVFEPRPGTDRVIATCADGLHFVGGQGKYLIERNTFDSLQDDNVNIILRGSTIDAVPHPDQLVLTPGSVRHYASGDTLRVYDLEGVSFSDYTIIEVVETAGRRFTLTLDRPVSEPIVLVSAIHEAIPTMVFNQSWNFGDVVIRENNFLNNRARAVRLAASGVVVENNFFDISAFPSVLVLTNVRDSLKYDEIDGFSNNITIRDNFIKRGLNNGGASGNPGAITVEIGDIKGELPENFRLMRDITISDNIIIDSGRSGIAVSGVDGLVIENNLIINPNQLSGVTSNCGIRLRDVSNDRVEGNLVLVTVLDDNLDYTNSSAMYAGGWEHVRGNNPGFFDYNGGRAAKLSNAQVKRDFSSIATITEGFELSAELALTQFSSGLYLLLTSAPDSEGKIYGYGMSWNAGTATGGYAPNGFLTIDTINGVDESSLAFGATIASNVVKSAAVNSAIGISGTGANVMAGSEFGSVRLTWEKATGQLNLYLGSSDEPAISITDSQYASFSHLYLSGNSSGYFNNMTLIGDNVGQPVCR